VRQWIGIESPRWTRSELQPEPFVSEWGAPYGAYQMRLPSGRSVEIDVPGTDFSFAYVDDAAGGVARVEIDGQERLRQPTHVAFVNAGGEKVYLEDRQGVRGLPYGLHT